MKTILAVVLAAGVSFAAASIFVSNRQAARYAAQLSDQEVELLHGFQLGGGRPGRRTLKPTEKGNTEPKDE